ncbi:uncharacterized protein SCHCODRAFT_02495058 [Schizophyllum commune H4-8]|uniref:Expressed protein n=1 Tax=Schizophyllum commune (strain H4-8 / FGSC 9210) TaxID=578458 RepID=D8Q2J8_SCHCM|nr:uncharacterized protein SCHCODRAFT_02495058 [Schizophyllum commune H4-8]KAI5894470.1 hypothetical protein SCHCODRAFT_02495058 [Schizophyllum commune H4-8]
MLSHAPTPAFRPAQRSTGYSLRAPDGCCGGSAFACPPPWLFSRICVSHKLPDPIHPHTNLPRRDTSSDRLLHVPLPLHVQFCSSPRSTAIASVTARSTSPRPFSHCLFMKVA